MDFCFVLLASHFARNKDELDVPDATSLAPSDITELDLRKEIKYGNRIQVITS